MVSATSYITSTDAPKMDIPVLISGGGPTGLYAAILLSKLNVPFRLVERNMEVRYITHKHTPTSSTVSQKSKNPSLC